MAVSALLTRQGYEVIYLGRFNTPERLAIVAEQEDADLIGVSVHSWELMAYVDELVERAHRSGIGVVVGGAVLTERDQVDLERRGVDAVFGAYVRESELLDRLAEIVGQVRDRQRIVPPGRGISDDRELPLDGRVVAVTGAAHGLGRAYVLELARLGAAVVAVDRDEPALLETVAFATGAMGTVTAAVVDVGLPDAGPIVLDAALAGYGQIDALVSNAGVLRSGPILHLDDDDVRSLFDVHVFANFSLLRAVGGYWRAEAKSGRQVDAAVVLTSSAAGLYGFRAEAAYSAAKAAVAMLTMVAADELGRYGATVNAVAPVARTRLTTWMGDAVGAPADDPFAPDHVAPVVAWLVGPGSREVTGRIVEVGGGWVSVPHSAHPGTGVPLPCHLSQGEAQVLLPQVLASTPPAPPLLSAEPVHGLPVPGVVPPERS